MSRELDAVKGLTLEERRKMGLPERGWTHGAVTKKTQVSDFKPEFADSLHRRGKDIENRPGPRKNKRGKAMPGVWHKFDFEDQKPHKRVIRAGSGNLSPGQRAYLAHATKGNQDGAPNPRVTLGAITGVMVLARLPGRATSTSRWAIKGQEHWVVLRCVEFHSPIHNVLPQQGPGVAAENRQTSPGTTNGSIWDLCNVRLAKGEFSDAWRPATNDDGDGVDRQFDMEAWELEYNKNKKRKNQQKKKTKSRKRPKKDNSSSDDNSAESSDPSAD